ncbi:DUF5819 family protein [Bacillus toyonensis]|uniref:Uncharacterized protein n=1 Tax=Bacillus toyonensis TaxID=155322 RepID=A0A2A8HBD6_9BACI|nr:DUF5819 family protein [Bacillus toyonensis]PEQ01700.1 hypothetical protein CN585_20955 [Bacillus toyonensis]
MIKKYSSSLMIILIAFIFSLHFTFTLLYNFPLNPISNKYNDSIQHYMNPLFKQNWKLFAPNPVSTNNILYIRGEYTDKNEELKKTEWVDASTPFNTIIHNNRLTPLRLVASMKSSLISEILNETTSDKDYLEKLNVSEDEDLIVLNRFSSNVLNEIHPNYKFLNVEKKIVVNVFPEYGKGKETEKNYEINLPTQPFQLPTT